MSNQNNSKASIGQRQTPARIAWRSLPLMLLLMLPVGCIQRTLTINSAPQGALVYLNGEEAGRTPFTHNFTWYGTYDVTLQKDGYTPIKTQAKVIAPWWQWVPLDFFTSMLPVTDAHSLSYELTRAPDGPIDPATILQRAEQLEKQLPATRPDTK